jgi:hypothetical protein
MSKRGIDGKPVYREDGKVLKGLNFTPPDLASIIARYLKPDVTYKTGVANYEGEMQGINKMIREYPGLSVSDSDVDEFKDERGATLTPDIILGSVDSFTANIDFKYPTPDLGCIPNSISRPNDEIWHEWDLKGADSVIGVMPMISAQLGSNMPPIEGIDTGGVSGVIYSDLKKEPPADRPTISADDIELVLTCGACPEQYDAYYNGKQVGYLRLRHGVFRVKYKDASGEMIYHAEPEGDGSFNDDERSFYLQIAKEAIVLKLKIERPDNWEPDQSYPHK